MNDLDSRPQHGSSSTFPAWEALGFLDAWMQQMLRLHQHNLLLWGDLWRKCL